MELGMPSTRNQGLIVPEPKKGKEKQDVCKWGKTLTNKCESKQSMIMNTEPFKMSTRSKKS